MIELSEPLKIKFNNLKSILIDKKVIVAFSGGVDSTLLGFISKKFAEDTILITHKSVLYSDEELEQAREFAIENDIAHIIIEGDPLENREFVSNPKNRCYICKKDIFSKFIEVKIRKKFDIITDGTNVDDLGDFRPGLDALKELGIISPFIMADMNKDDIRNLSKYFNLNAHSKPSSACFASRIPYNQKITKEKLEMIKEAEMHVKNLLGVSQLRVRYHEEKLARVELLEDDFSLLFKEENRLNIIEKLKKIGFCYIAFDLEGFRSGSLNEVMD